MMACLNREVSAAAERLASGRSGSQDTEIAAAIVNDCSRGYMPGVFLAADNPMYEKVRSALDMQAATSRALSAYGACLQKTVPELALKSNEPPAVTLEAARSQCGTERNASISAAGWPAVSNAEKETTGEWIAAVKRVRAQAAAMRQKRAVAAAGKQEREAALNAYGTCLHDAIPVFALASPEPAETIVKAATGQCYAERTGLAKAGLDPDAVDRETIPTAISIVIKTRAQAALQQTQILQQPAGTLPAAKQY
jgi:hypothetical protein